MVKKVWTEERIAWLWQHRTESGKKLLEMFNKEFPEAHTTYNGIITKRSEIGASIPRRPSEYERRKPLYSEQIKKGYVKIKIAQPSVWEYKQKWVWMETHPELYNTVKPTDVFIFLDGNNRNFDPKNIYKLTRAELVVLNSKGGVEKGNPEMTLFRIAKAKLIIATLDAGEKYGLVADGGGGGRVFKEIRNAKERAYKKERYRTSPEYRQKVKEWRENYKKRHKR